MTWWIGWLVGCIPAPCASGFADLDGDGFGDPNVVVERCGDEPAEGIVANRGDCDDTDPNVHPNALEVCDEAGVDEDCDGLANNDDLAEGAVLVWPDADGDGFGDGTAAALAVCTPPANTSERRGDCDDANATVFPAAPERCDGVVNACGGTLYELGLISIDDGETYDDLGTALLDATAWDTVRICGTHRGVFEVGVPLILVGHGDAILDGQDQGTVLAVQPDTVVEGLTITQGLAEQGGGRAAPQCGAADSSQRGGRAQRGGARGRGGPAARQRGRL